MSIYLEFPAIEDYPLYVPLENITASIPEWVTNALHSCLPDSELLKNENNGFEIVNQLVSK
ncbi:hypothetical protein D3C87_1303150 [compost metagenome]